MKLELAFGSLTIRNSGSVWFGVVLLVKPCQPRCVDILVAPGTLLPPTKKATALLSMVCLRHKPWRISISTVQPACHRPEILSSWGCWRVHDRGKRLPVACLDQLVCLESLTNALQKDRWRREGISHSIKNVQRSLHEHALVTVHSQLQDFYDRHF